MGKEGRARRDPTRSRTEPTVHVGDLYATGEKRRSFSFCKHFPDFSHKKNGHHLHEKVRSLSLSSAPHSQSSVKSNTANDTCRATVWASPGPELQRASRTPGRLLGTRAAKHTQQTGGYVGTIAGLLVALGAGGRPLSLTTTRPLGFPPSSGLRLLRLPADCPPHPPPLSVEPPRAFRPSLLVPS